MFFGNKAIKVNTSELIPLQNQGLIQIITPDDAFDIIKKHSKGKVRREAGNLKANMIRNNEILIFGEIPENIIQKAK